MRPGVRYGKSAAPTVNAGAVFVQIMKSRLTSDPRTHAEFIADIRTKQAAGQPNPAIAALLHRLEGCANVTAR